MSTGSYGDQLRVTSLYEAGMGLTPHVPIALRALRHEEVRA